MAYTSWDDIYYIYINANYLKVIHAILYAKHFSARLNYQATFFMWGNIKWAEWNVCEYTLMVWHKIEQFLLTSNVKSF